MGKNLSCSFHVYFPDIPVEAASGFGDRLLGEVGGSQLPCLPLPQRGFLPPWGNPLHPKAPSLQVGLGVGVPLPHLLGLHFELSGQGVRSPGI